MITMAISTPPTLSMDRPHCPSPTTAYIYHILSLLVIQYSHVSILCLYPMTFLHPMNITRRTDTCPPPQHHASRMLAPLSLSCLGFHMVYNTNSSNTMDTQLLPSHVALQWASSAFSHIHRFSFFRFYIFLRYRLTLRVQYTYFTFHLQVYTQVPHWKISPACRAI